MMGQMKRERLRIFSLLILLSAVLTFLLTNVTAETGGNILSAYHTPSEPFAGQTVTIWAELENVTLVDQAQIQYCTVNPETLEVGVCYFLPMTDLGNKTFASDIPAAFDGGTMMGYKVILQYENLSLEYAPEHDYYYYNYSGAKKLLPPSVEIPAEVIIAETILGLCIASLVGILVYRKIKKVKPGADKTLIIGIVTFIIIAVLYGSISMSGLSNDVGKVEDFSLVDIYGNPWNLSDHSGKVVVLDFMATSCAPCEVLRKSLEPAVNSFDENELEVISVAVGPDTDPVLRQYKIDREVEWTIARDTTDLVSTFGVAHLPKLVIIDRDGYATFETFDSETSTDKFKSEINAAMEGSAQPISIQQISILATGVFLGIAVYFSPCAFPMLPGYVSIYLSTEAEGKKKSLRTVLASGVITGFGMVLVFLIIGLIAISLGSAANLGRYIIYAGPVVGSILIVLGALMFTDLQYHVLVRPFRKLRVRLFGERIAETESQKGYYSKLFSYGVGYGAASSACTAPLFIALLLATMVAGSFWDGFAILLAFSVAILLLMIAITLLLSSIGQESVQKLSAHTEKIKKISGIILVIVGSYIIYYYITTFA